MWEVINPCPNLNWLIKTTVEVKAWVSNYIPLFCVDIITDSYPNFDVGLADLF